MKRGAFIAALAAIVLLAVLWAQRWGMGACHIEHKIITPDGEEFPFTWRIVPGSPELDYPLEGDGLPQIEHLSQEIYSMPGALYKGTIVKPRLLTFTASMWGRNQKALMRLKAKMQGALRWDRGDPGDPSIYRITVDGVSRDLYVRYDSSVERRLWRPGLVSVVALRLIAYDPFFYDPVTQEQVLDWGDAFTVRSIAVKVEGVWSPLGPPTAVGGARAPNSIAIDPETGNIIVGGAFTGWDGLPGVTGDNIVRYNVTTNTWQAIGGGLNAIVYEVFFGPDGTLFAVGAFTNGSGGVGDALANWIAQYDPGTDTWVNVGGGPGVAGGTTITDAVIGFDGRLYVVGDFTNFDGTGGDRICTLPLPYAAGGWAAIGDLDNIGWALAIASNGNIFVGGAFHNAGGIAASHIVEYDPATPAWLVMGTGVNNTVQCLDVGPDGLLYLGGAFTQTGGGGSLNGIGIWNGSTFIEPDGGVNSNVFKLDIDDDGILYTVGAFNLAGDLPVQYVARWNGYSWASIDADLVVGVGGIYAVTCYGDDLYFGFSFAAGTALLAGDSPVVNLGNVFSLPIVEIKNAGHLMSIRNETMGYDIPCDMLIQDGEIVTIDLSSGVKSCESTWRPQGRLGDILPASDMATFCLESYPRANHGGVQGANLITVFISDADPRKTGDTGDQLDIDEWVSVTGVTQSNTDLGRLYVSIVADGGGWYHIDLYEDFARTELVGHTVSYNGAGVLNVVEDNDSGLGGTLGVHVPFGANNDITVWFTIVTLFWSNRWWDLDTAVS